MLDSQLFSKPKNIQVQQAFNRHRPSAHQNSGSYGRLQRIGALPFDTGSRRAVSVLLEEPSNHGFCFRLSYLFL